MHKIDKIGQIATKIYKDRYNYTCVRYHNTEVVKFNERIAILNSGGWRTATTKRRINQASSQFNLGFTIYQRSGDWFVRIGADIKPFSDGMVLDLSKSNTLTV